MSIQTKSFRPRAKLKSKDKRQYYNLARRVVDAVPAIQKLDGSGVRQWTPAIAEVFLEVLIKAETAQTPFREFKRGVYAGGFDAALKLFCLTPTEQQKTPEPKVACKAGCAFCCVFEATIPVSALELDLIWFKVKSSNLDGRDWRKQACPALNPVTRECQAHSCKPLVCKGHYSQNVDSCRPADGDIGKYLNSPTEYMVGPESVAARTWITLFHVVFRKPYPTYDLKVALKRLREGMPRDQVLKLGAAEAPTRIEVGLQKLRELDMTGPDNQAWLKPLE